MVDGDSLPVLGRVISRSDGADRRVRLAGIPAAENKRERPTWNKDTRDFLFYPGPTMSYSRRPFCQLEITVSNRSTTRAPFILSGRSNDDNGIRIHERTRIGNLISETIFHAIKTNVKLLFLSSFLQYLIEQSPRCILGSRHSETLLDEAFVLGSNFVR